MKARFLAVIPALVLGAAAHASSGGTVQAVPDLGILVRAGIFMPSTGAGSASGSQWFTAGVEFGLMRLGVGAPGTRGSITASVDTYNSGGASGVPILVNYAVDVNEFRYSAGVGIGVANRPGFDTTTQLAYQLSLGYNFNFSAIPFIAEIRWFSITNVGAALDGFALTLGMRL